MTDTCSVLKNRIIHIYKNIEHGTALGPELLQSNWHTSRMFSFPVVIHKLSCSMGVQQCVVLSPKTGVLTHIVHSAVCNAVGSQQTYCRNSFHRIHVGKRHILGKKKTIFCFGLQFVMMAKLVEFFMHQPPLHDCLRLVI